MALWSAIVHGLSYWDYGYHENVAFLEPIEVHVVACGHDEWSAQVRSLDCHALGASPTKAVDALARAISSSAQATAAIDQRKGVQWTECVFDGTVSEMWPLHDLIIPAFVIEQVGLRDNGRYFVETTPTECWWRRKVARIKQAPSVQSLVSLLRLLESPEHMAANKWFNV